MSDKTQKWEHNFPPLLPRLIRLRDAPFYTGMDRNRFNSEVRPYLVQIPIGEQGIAFDRLELDAWVEQYKSRNGRPGRLTGDQLWDAKRYRGSSSAPASGTSTNASAGGEFARALARIDLRKPSASSQD
jgi:predicted DNA-binding transcriptional regulator AlpA